jgi:hypothetical protein
MAATKKECPISRKHFKEHASALTLSIAGNAVVAQVKEFSTGSLGWYANGKVTLEVGGEKVTVQVGITLTVVGSKELPA